MRRAVLGTLAVHSVVALALLAIGGRDVVLPGSPPRLELVDITPSPASVSSITTPPSLAATSGGGAPARAAARVHHAAPAPQVLHGDLVSDIVGTAAVDIAPGNGTGDGGNGHGHGGGIGDGIGLGASSQIAAPPPPPPAPPPPKISKARPPRLIFPARGRDVENAEEPFIAAVVIDEDGYVVGAHLVRGHGGPRDAMASSLIFRFRYEPALDDDGNAITARIEQPFLVE